MKRTIIALLLVACCISACFVGGTFAKYTSTVTGSDTVTVAKWSIKVDDQDIAANQVPAFDLFTTANFDEADNDVANGKIAPGTKGSFAFKVENEAEVTVEYGVSFTVTWPANLSSAQFKFYSDSAMTNEIVLADGKYTVVADGTELAIGAEAVTTTIYWQWIFGDPANNTNDTAAGVAAGTLTIAPTITVNQVD